MISEKFSKKISVNKYLDPFNGFKEKALTFEVRHDEITGVTTRILPLRSRGFQKPDISHYLEKSPPDKCPFCLPQLDLLTPRFTPDVHPSGQFRRGEAVLFPNAFPHDQHNGVALFSSQHYLSMEDLTPETMKVGFLVCRDYFERMLAIQPDLGYASINWNYMPPSGGGLIHPHLQTVMGQCPTRFMQTLYDSALRYKQETGRLLWTDLLAEEKEAGERYIASTGNVEWTVSFAPMGMAGEIDFYIPGKASIFALTEEVLEELLLGLKCVFAYFIASNLISFNMALYATLREDRLFPLQGRIIPRFPILPLGASDVNYFDKLHQEIICPIVPEYACEHLKTHFQDSDVHK